MARAPERSAIQRALFKQGVKLDTSQVLVPNAQRDALAKLLLTLQSRSRSRLPPVAVGSPWAPKGRKK